MSRLGRERRKRGGAAMPSRLRSACQRARAGRAIPSLGKRAELPIASRCFDGLASVAGRAACSGYARACEPGGSLGTCVTMRLAFGFAKGFEAADRALQESVPRHGLRFAELRLAARSPRLPLCASSGEGSLSAAGPLSCPPLVVGRHADRPAVAFLRAALPARAQ